MNLRAFALGLMWAGLAALSPVVSSVIDDVYHNEFTDWHKAKRQSVLMGFVGAGAYWRKHKALLKLPPYLSGVIPPDG